jgi:hypothetical protein
MQGFYKTHTNKIGNLVYGGATVVWTYSHLPNLVTVMRDGLFAKLPSFPPELKANQITAAISQQIAEMKTEYPSEMEQQQFLYALSTGTEIRFVRVTGGIVDEPGWACIGVGDSSLVNFISKNFTFAPACLTSTSEALPLAIYMVYLAKQFVDGVGGPTDAVILRHGEAVPDFLLGHYIQRLEGMFENMHFCFRDVYNILTNPNISDENAERLIQSLANGIRNIRKGR